MNREKAYKSIYSHNITLGIVRDRETDFIQLKKDLEETAKDLKIIVDFRARIRPVGINMESLRYWLIHDNIFDEDDPTSPTKNLEEISKAYFGAS